MPRNTMALRTPLSSDESARSHSADGSRKETERISMASEALAQPQMKRCQ